MEAHRLSHSVAHPETEPTWQAVLRRTADIFVGSALVLLLSPLLLIVSLAIRIETLLVTAEGETVRPPRAVAMGLALYLWRLAKAAPVDGKDDAETPGAMTFRARCASCHQCST